MAGHGTTQRSEQPTSFFPRLTYAGRSLHSCQIVFEEMKRQMSSQSGTMRPMTTTSYVNIAPHPVGGTNRSVSEHNPSQLNTRALYPRPPLRSTESPNPPATNGGSPTLTRQMLTESGPDTMTKKRGRPSKAEVEERTRRLALEGKQYQPKKRPTKRPRHSLPVDVFGTKQEDIESPTPLLQAPIATIFEPGREESNETRRYRRSIREELTPEPTNTEGHSATSLDESGLDVPVAESPSDRLLASHRDRGSVGSSLSRPTQQESETMDQRQSDSEQHA